MLRKALLPLAVVFTALLLAGCATASAASNLKVSAGYADNLQTIGARSNSPTFPNPWQGGSKVNFKGVGDKFDAGAIRIENPTGSDATVEKVTVDIGPKHYDLWGSGLRVPANGSLILTQTELGTANPPAPNFDSSEPNSPAGTSAAAQGSNAVPVIHVKINGNTTNFQDTAKILNTSGTDKGDLPGAPNESHQWQQIGTLNGGGSSNAGLSPLLLFAPLAAMMLGLFSFIPKLIGALILLAIGWWLAKLAARLVVGLLDRLGFGSAAERTGMFGFMGASATARRGGSRPSWLIGEIVKWFVFLIFVELAAVALGLPAVSALLHRIILWIPNLVVALLILFIAALAAQFVGRLVRGASRGNARYLGSLVEYGIIALAAVVALNQLGIGAVFVDILFAAVIAALALAAGLAFGLGGRGVASQIWSQSYGGMKQQARTPTSRPTPTVSTVKSPTPIESSRQH
jgi:Conserved TM helix